MFYTFRIFPFSLGFVSMPRSSSTLRKHSVINAAVYVRCHIYPPTAYRLFFLCMPPFSVQVQIITKHITSEINYVCSSVLSTRLGLQTIIRSESHGYVDQKQLF